MTESLEELGFEVRSPLRFPVFSQEYQKNRIKVLTKSGSSRYLNKAPERGSEASPTECYKKGPRKENSLEARKPGPRQDNSDCSIILRYSGRQIVRDERTGNGELGEASEIFVIFLQK
jgi:hypothetical protein